MRWTIHSRKFISSLDIKLKPYLVPSGSVQTEDIVKKSRFIARVIKVTDRQQALAEVAVVQREFSDARHVCWAYVLGNPASASSAAMNDDGEPSGTAGRPILNVIQHKNVGDVLVIVIRYFGGIKLGAGGLVRAYSGAAESVLSAASYEEQLPAALLKLRVDFSTEQFVRHWLTTKNADVLEVEYGESVTLDVSLSPSDLSELESLAAARGFQILPPG